VQENNDSKEYLNQLKRLDICINQKQEELRYLRSLTVSVSVNTKSERVQTTIKTDKMAGIIVKIICLEEEVRSEIEKYVKMKHRIINEIQSIDDEVYINILFKKYVEYKTLEQISNEMNYSYDRTKHLHVFALKSFKTLYS